MSTLGKLPSTSSAGRETTIPVGIGREAPFEQTAFTATTPTTSDEGKVTASLTNNESLIGTTDPKATQCDDASHAPENSTEPKISIIKTWLEARRRWQSSAQETHQLASPTQTGKRTLRELYSGETEEEGERRSKRVKAEVQEQLEPDMASSTIQLPSFDFGWDDLPYSNYANDVVQAIAVLEPGDSGPDTEGANENEATGRYGDEDGECSSASNNATIRSDLSDREIIDDGNASEPLSSGSRDTETSPPAVATDNADELDIHSLLYEDSEEELDELASLYSDVQSQYDDEEENEFEGLEDTDAEDYDEFEPEEEPVACGAEEPEAAERPSDTGNEDDSDALSETSETGASANSSGHSDSSGDENFDVATILQFALAGDTRRALGACPVSQQPIRIVGPAAVAAELARPRETPLKYRQVSRPKEATICRLRVELENGVIKHSPQPCHNTFLVGQNSKSGDTYIRHLGRAHFRI